MARKTALTIENLVQLGADKLAALVLEESESSPAFKRKIAAALAARDGPAAIAKIIDQRLSGLERARGFISWEKARAFRDDLASLVDIIVNELVRADPEQGADRLLRFIVTHENVFERVDDSSGSIQDVYYRAIEELGTAVPALQETAAAALPDMVMARLGETAHGYLGDAAEAIIPHLSNQVLTAWDDKLVSKIAVVEAQEARTNGPDRWIYSMASQWREIRRNIAIQCADLDGLIALERQKPEHTRNNYDIASRLLDAGRAEEALDWIRKPERYSLLQVDSAAQFSNAFRSPLGTMLEARILDSMGRRSDARELLWSGFASTLVPDLLRQHLKLLADFDDVEAEEEAMTLVMGHTNAMAALSFFMEWKRPDLAARLVVLRHDAWDGSNWHTLPDIAETLAHAYPAAATLLYRALVDDVLAKARSKAYHHAAKYLLCLVRMAPDVEVSGDLPENVPSHSAYLASLRASHGRKSGFWVQAREAGGIE